MESLFSRTTVQFIAAYENLNFRIAAEKCLVTQPAITKSIKKIEKSIDPNSPFAVLEKLL